MSYFGYWWTKSLPTQRATVTGVYTDAALGTAYVSGGTAGATLYFKMSASDESQFRPGHEILLRDASDYSVDVVGKVVAVKSNGASSYLQVKLLEADDNSSSGDLSDCDTALVIGNMNSEGALPPNVIAYDSTKIYNYTQIFRTPLEITRTAKLTRLRTGDAYKEMKREALELHSIEMEKAFIWGIMTENTGDNGKPERTTRGLVNIVNSYASSNVSNYPDDHSGDTWLTSGEDWMDESLEEMFRYGSTERLCFAGSSALLGIQRLVKNSGQFQISEKTVSYGIKVLEWVTPFGSIYIKTHPLFSYEATNRNTMLLFDPSDIKTRFITDTTFYPDGEKQNTGHNHYDGLKEEFLTEIGMEFHFPTGWGILHGVGVDG